MAPNKDLDVLVWGSTGFTGSLVVRHIAESYADSDLKFGLHGRSLDRLKKVQADLVKELGPKFLDRVELIVGDANDQASVDKAVSRAKAVISTAGPFARYGTPVVESAVKNKTNYADITGETPWVRSIIDKFHATAEKDGVKVVPMCGYDSIPSDIGTLFAVTELAKKHPGVKIDNISVAIGESKGGFSGGTIESGFNLVQQFNSEELNKMTNPFYLNPGMTPPPGVKDTYAHGDAVLPRWDAGLNSYVGPFVMAPINSRVVRRSDALLGFPFGDSILYQEGMKVPGIIPASIVSAFTVGIGAVFALKSLHPYTRKLLPAPGQGPSREAQVNGFWNQHISVTGTAPGGKKVSGLFTMAGRRDPGYYETSRFLLESGICLATQGEECEKQGRLKGGVLTPASAMGPILIERLKKAGIRFTVDRLD